MPKLQKDFINFLFNENIKTFLISENKKDITTLLKENYLSNNEKIGFVFRETRNIQGYPVISYNNKFKRQFIGIVLYSRNIFYTLEENNLIYKLPVSINHTNIESLGMTLDDIYINYRNIIKSTICDYIKASNQYNKYKKSDLKIDESEVKSFILYESITNDSLDIELIKNKIFPFFPYFDYLDLDNYLFVGLLTNPEKEIKNWWKQYISNETNFIIPYIIYEKKIKLIDYLLNNPNFMKILEFAIQVNKLDAKTVVLHYEKENKKISLTFPVKYIGFAKDDFYYGFIKNLTQRKEYETLFGTNNIEWEHITEISYGKKTLYNK